jgi:preprotein translocase subunit SecA
MIKMLSKISSQKSSTRYLKKYYSQVNKINSLEEKYEKLTNEELCNMTKKFREDLENGKTIDDIKLDAFAVVREASKRVLGMRHFDVQLIGGLVLTEGNISEMPTGEGKTLVASLPSYVRALEGKGVHVITVNDYLAKRDKDLIGPVHEFLGLKVGLNLPMMEVPEKKGAYQADITYGVGTEFGFDFLRDNMARSSEEKVQRPYHFAIIDEVDSVLIDEAKTPLIIAGKMKSSSELHYIASKLAKRFKIEEDYEFDLETKATSLTDQGIEKVEKAFGVDNLYELEHQTLYHYVIQAVRAHVMFERDVDYIVHEGKVQLVDMFTGRIMDGRTLSDGLHQAIEAKEGLEITEENKTQAQITIQNYFRMYPHLSGMTGTAKTEEKEFQQVYGMSVVPIPTNKPKIRVDMEDKVFQTKEQKYHAMVEEVKKRHKTGQPILIGTTSILQSETVAQYLDDEKLTYELLNAKSVEQEVQLISHAGQKNQITIATNMAGRGTDILLGEQVDALGGLHVLGTEKHESRRVDNQLRGRSGRQGDPGSSQFFLSLEDDMFRRYAKDDLEKLHKKLKTDKNGQVLGKNIHEFIERVQRIVEGSNYSFREYNLKLDDVVNEQRNVFYTLRDKILSEEDMIIHMSNMITSTYQNALEEFCPDEVIPEEWPLDRMAALLNAISFEEISLEGLSEKPELKSYLDGKLEKTLAYLEKYTDNTGVNSTLRRVILSFIDFHWVKHLENMIRLKEGVGLRQYQQEDPMRLYQKEGLDLFTDMFHALEKDISLETVQFIKKMENQ